jgi:hypothetical protein
MSQFELGQKSLKELEGVHPDLVAVVKRAIELTVQDFAVHDGLRTIDEQKKLVASGAKSVHMTLAHFVTASEKSPLAPLCQRGEQNSPL